MSNIVIVGFITEGATDVRFLESIIRRTFEEIAAFECKSEISVHDVYHIEVKEHTFIDKVKSAAEIAHKSGVMVLCVHTDSDHENDNLTFENKINPSLESLKESEIPCCNVIVPIVPIRMTEAWMLVDKNLLKSEIGTNKTDNELGINRHPESIADPKFVIEEAIRIATVDNPKRRNRINISELYLPLGQKISLTELNKLDSFKKFKENVKNAFAELNYLNK